MVTKSAKVKKKATHRHAHRHTDRPTIIVLVRCGGRKINIVYHSQMIPSARGPRWEEGQWQEEGGGGSGVIEGKGSESSA